MPVLVSRLCDLLVALYILTLSCVAPVVSQTVDRPLCLNEDGRPMLAPLQAAVAPAVVNISGESRQAAELKPLFNDPIFRRFFQYATNAEAATTAPPDERRIWRGF